MLRKPKPPDRAVGAIGQHRFAAPNLIVLVGPTASGKSELAVKLAKRFNGEIISADSRQIYRGLDIGTGKIRGKWRTWQRGFPIPGNGAPKQFIYKGIPHHCIDFVSARKIYTVAEFKKCAEAAIKYVTNRGKVPILCGGTAFWIDAVVYDLKPPEVPPNPLLRRRLEKKSAAELLKILQKLDPERAKTIEQKNPRRLIRAIEIAKSIGRSPELKRLNPYKVLWLGLNPPRKTWSRRMQRRIRGMINHGILRETKTLLESGLSKKRLREFGFEYRAALEYLEKKISGKELRDEIIRGTLDYAQRQMRWWKRNKSIIWRTGLESFYPRVKTFLKTP